MKVINCTLFQGNPYTKAIYSSIVDKYEPVKGDIDLAVKELREHGVGALHIHWEEHLIRHCCSEEEAQHLVRYFVARLDYYKKLGGVVLWTVHNSLPHELEYVDIFLNLRAEIAKRCDRILVHNIRTIALLLDQGINYANKVFMLPHPSYLGVYGGKMADPVDVGALSCNRTILSFGLVRRYKNLERLFLEIDPTFTRENNLRIHVAGAAISGDGYGAELEASCAGRDDVFFDLRHIPDASIPDLMANAGCLVLPYDRFLTSGAALLGISFGKIVIGPRTPQFVEVLPASVHRFLYDPDVHGDLRRAVLEVAGLSVEDHQAIVRDLLERAEYYSPAVVSAQLGQLLDLLIEASDKKSAASKKSSVAGDATAKSGEQTKPLGQRLYGKRNRIGISVGLLSAIRKGRRWFRF